MKVEKSELKKNFTKLTQKKGISLIVLVVTIIVIIILAAAVILTVGKNNPVESAKEAKFKEDIRSFQYDLALSISKDYTSRAGQRDYKFSGTTYEEITNYIPSFTKEYEGKLIVKDDELMYPEDLENKVISQKEKEWLKETEIKEYAKTAAEKVYEDTSYYGKRITNYSANGVTDWKIFHSDGKNVYIIASDYVPVDKLPETSTKHKPVNANSDYPKAATFNNIIGDYTGSSNITDEKIKALNKSYFDYLEENKTVSKNENMKAVAYMLDTEIWNSFKTEKAEYAIGGSTVEILMASYSKKHKVDYIAQAISRTGYQISKDGGISWANYYINMLSTNDSLYVLPRSNGAYAMWLASPSANNWNYVMNVDHCGYVDYHDYEDTSIGFRPLVCLKSDIQLEADGAGYKIK